MPNQETLPSTDMRGQNCKNQARYAARIDYAPGRFKLMNESSCRSALRPGTGVSNVGQKLAQAGFGDGQTVSATQTRFFCHLLNLSADKHPFSRPDRGRQGSTSAGRVEERFESPFSRPHRIHWRIRARQASSPSLSGPRPAGQYFQTM